MDSRNSIYAINRNLNNVDYLGFKGDYFSVMSFFQNSSQFTKHHNILLSYFLNNYSNYFELKSSSSASRLCINSRFDWNPYNFSIELDKYSFLLKFKHGLFFLNNFNFGTMNNLSTNFGLYGAHQIASDHINSAK
jgi:hypothetical protein